MKNLFCFLYCFIMVVFISSCKKDTNEALLFNKLNASVGPTYNQAALLPVKTLNADITINTTWDKDTVYQISGIVTVRNNATLVIQAGTYIKSTINTIGVANGVLVVAKDGSINAMGDVNNPIVFTSRYLLDGNASTTGSPGDFGGVVILGDAVINSPSRDKLIEGLPDQAKFHYGGNDNIDNRGIFQYVRVEYAGFRLLLNDEINALTLGAVGSGTTIDHIQVSYGIDDGFEFFGGTVNPSYLLALASNDDQFDFDNGYTGTIQYGLALADRNIKIGTNSNGIEADNTGAIPVTHPNLVHFSIIGLQTRGTTTSNYNDGIQVENAAQIEMSNSVITGYPKGIVFENTTSPALSKIISTSVHGFSDNLIAGSPVPGTGRILSTPGMLSNNWNMTAPWFNLTPGNLDFSIGSGPNAGRGADDGTWLHENWVKYNY